MNLESKFVTVKGNTFHIVEDTEGSIPVLMAHGYTDSWRCLKPIAERLPSFTRTIMYDAKAHGLTDAPDSGYSEESMADDMYKISRELGLDDPILFGHSLGANTAALATRQFSSLRCIILEDPAGQMVNNLSTEERHKDNKNDLRNWRLSSHKKIRERYDRVPNFGEELATARKQLRPEVIKIDKRGYSYVHNLLSSHPPETLILRPDPDEVDYPVGSSKEIFDEVTVQTVDNSTHTIFRDNPDEFINIVNKFLKSECA